MRLKATFILSLSTLIIKLFKHKRASRAALEEPYQETDYKTEDCMVFAATAADPSGLVELDRLQQFHAFQPYPELVPSLR